jgi:hypothetical protein
MKRFLFPALLLLVSACGGGLVDHAGVDLQSLTQLQCTLPQQDCGTGVCVPTDTDVNNCGACGHMCATPQHATSSCAESECAFTCNSGYFRCASEGCCPASALAAGGDTSCAIVSGSVQCWGSNSSGQLGTDPTGAGWSAKPVDVPVIPAASFVAVGLGHVCAIAAGTGDVWCWGANDSGQLGGVTGRGPGQVPGVTSATALALGDRHSCAITGAGTSATMLCWGADDVGQLGRGTSSATPRTPGAVGGLSSVTSISAGTAFTCAIGSSGGGPNLYCWGDGSLGEFGSGPASNSATPVVVNGPSSPSLVASGSAHACAIGSGFWCWGADDSGQVGDGKQNPTAQVSGPGVQSPVAVAGGSAHTCAISSAGTPFCWGANESGQLGTGNAILQTKPAAVSAIAAVQRIALGSRHSCAQTTASGAVYCWGNNSSSQVGAPSGGTFLMPRPVDSR